MNIFLLWFMIKWLLKLIYVNFSRFFLTYSIYWDNEKPEYKCERTFYQLSEYQNRNRKSFFNQKLNKFKKYVCFSIFSNLIMKSSSNQSNQIILNMNCHVLLLSFTFVPNFMIIAWSYLKIWPRAVLTPSLPPPAGSTRSKKAQV